MSTYFAAVNRGKRSVAIDLGRERGRELLRELAASADVLIENFRPGVTARLGIGYEALAARNPELIYASITGFGSRGPKAAEAGTEVIVEAETGLMAMMGTPDGPPVRFGVAMVDIATGATLVGGVLAAALERTRTGCGRRLEFPLYAMAFSCLATVIASASVDPASQGGRWGSGHPSIVPYSAFEASDGVRRPRRDQRADVGAAVRGFRARRPAHRRARRDQRRPRPQPRARRGGDRGRDRPAVQRM
jgi:crotonobetainyl-CoA:carnitine CoA-transferase CaiB-like acyl-CoA transferase